MELSSSNLIKSEKTESRWAILWLAALISSYYYVLPLGRYSLGGTASDFRLFDFVFIGFMMFVGIPRLAEVRALFNKQHIFVRYSIIFMWFVLMSLGLTFVFAGQAKFLAAGLRGYRFLSYFVAAAYVLVLVDNPSKFRLIFRVIYVNLIIQALLSFFQAQGWIPGFWPSYWLVTYGEWPVGTLSPHHKHIGVVLLLGLALTLTLLRQTKSWYFKLGYLVLIIIMILDSIYTGARTAWLAFIALYIADAFVYRSLNLFPILFISIGLGLLFFFGSPDFLVPLETQLQERLFAPLEDEGIDGIASERTVIYFQLIPDAIERNPWVLLTGTGFQNISDIMAATGAHNNYLQAILELGIFGFLAYMLLIYKICTNLWQGARNLPPSFEKYVAGGGFVAFIAVLATMLVGESFWAQYSMFTLTGQIMTLVALAVSPLLWMKSPQYDAIA
jgi:O-antigen ligase